MKAEGEAEKNFDTLLVTISSVALAASFTLMKDVVKGTTVSLILSWVLLGICLVGSLFDRLYTYRFHKEWRSQLDNVFENYVSTHCGHGWKECDARLNALRIKKIFRLFPAARFLDSIKWVNAIALLLGIGALMIYVAVGAGSQPQVAASPAPSPVTVNVFNPPTTRPSP